MEAAAPTARWRRWHYNFRPADPNAAAQWDWCVSMATDTDVAVDVDAVVAADAGEDDDDASIRLILDYFIKKTREIRE